MFNSTLLVADWIANSFPIIRIVLFCLIAISAVALIALVLMQSGDAQGTDVLTGGQESYYSRNKGASKAGKIKIATIVFASIIFVCVILYIVTVKVFPGVAV